MAKPSWTEQELFATLDAWPMPQGFHIEVDRCRVTGRLFVRIFNGDGCAVTAALGAESLDHLPPVLDRGVHCLHKDHMYCIDQCKDRHLRRHCRSFDRWAERYAQHQRNKVLARKILASYTDG